VKSLNTAARPLASFNVCCQVPRAPDDADVCEVARPTLQTDCTAPPKSWKLAATRHTTTDNIGRPHIIPGSSGNHGASTEHSPTTREEESPSHAGWLSSHEGEDSSREGQVPSRKGEETSRKGKEETSRGGSDLLTPQATRRAQEPVSKDGATEDSA
jgi:hypothetical protein